MCVFSTGSLRRFNRSDASGHGMSNGRVWCIVNATRGIVVQRGRRPLERSNGNGQRRSWLDGQPERLPFAGQDFVSAVRNHLFGFVFGIGGRQ